MLQWYTRGFYMFLILAYICYLQNWRSSKLSTHKVSHAIAHLLLCIQIYLYCISEMMRCAEVILCVATRSLFLVGKNFRSQFLSKPWFSLHFLRLWIFCYINNHPVTSKLSLALASTSHIVIPPTTARCRVRVVVWRAFSSSPEIPPLVCFFRHQMRLRWFFTPFGASGPSSLLKLSRPWLPTSIYCYSTTALVVVMVCLVLFSAAWDTSLSVSPGGTHREPLKLFPAWPHPILLFNHWPGYRTVVGLGFCSLCSLGYLLGLFLRHLGPHSLPISPFRASDHHRTSVILGLFYPRLLVLQLLCPVVGCSVFVSRSFERPPLFECSPQPFPWFGLH
jgi:hypothetical protein